MAFGDLIFIQICKRECRNKGARLNTKSVNVLQDNENIIFGVIFSSRHKSINHHVISQSLGFVGDKQYVKQKVFFLE